MTNLELAKEQGNQAAPNVIDAAKASEVQIDVTLAQEQGNQAAPLIADSLASSESYDAIKQQGNQAMPLIVDALVQPTPPTPPTPTVEYMYFEAAQANSTVSMVSTLTTAPDLEYSTDGETWQVWQHTTAEGTHTFDTLTLTNIGDRVYLRGDNPNGLGTMPEGAEMPLFSNFGMTGKIAAGGNIMSLLDKDAEMTEIPGYGFILLFGNIAEENPNTSLTTAAAMPALTTIGNGGCAYMYVGCTALTAAAAMPALTTIGNGGCNGMYDGCTFDMSNDGITFNFDFGATPPVTAGDTTYNTYYDIAQWMGNTTGFTTP